MGNHPEDRRVDPKVGESSDTEHHKAHMSDRRERNEAFHVFLSKASKRSVNDANNC